MTHVGRILARVAGPESFLFERLPVLRLQVVVGATRQAVGYPENRSPACCSLPSVRRLARTSPMLLTHHWRCNPLHTTGLLCWGVAACHECSTATPAVRQRGLQHVAIVCPTDVLDAWAWLGGPRSFVFSRPRYGCQRCAVRENPSPGYASLWATPVFYEAPVAAPSSFFV